MEALKQSILEVITDDEYDTADLLAILSPLSNYVDSPIFMKYLSQITQVITEDRNGDQKFTIDDLKLIQTDIIAITSIVQGLLLAFSALSDLKLKYDSKTTEDTVFKLLAYVFLVTVPKEVGSKLTLDDKKAVLEIVLSMYQIFASSKAVQDLLKKMSGWFKNKCKCKCFCGSAKTGTTEEIIETKMEDITKDIRRSLQPKE